MEVSITVPEAITAQSITEFRFRPGSKKAIVIFNQGGEQKSTLVDFQSIIDLATATQKTAVKQFFKRTGAKALDDVNESIGVDVVEGDVTGDLFDDV